MKLKPVRVKGDIFWAELTKKNKNTNKYQVAICNLSDEAVTRLEDAGLSVHSSPDKPDQGKYITPKSSNYEIKAYDEVGNEITCKIKNGSKGIATIKPYVNGFDKGINAGISALTVTDLIEYNEADMEAV